MTRSDPPVTPAAPTATPFSELEASHRALESRLDTLRGLVEGLARRGPGGDSRAAADLRRTLADLEEAAVRHHADEDASLFPRLARARTGSPAGDELARTLARLTAEHTAAARLLAAFKGGVETALGREGGPSRNDLVILAARLVALTRHLRAHMALEQREVFPAARAALAADEAALGALASEMAARRERVADAAPAGRDPGAAG
jgi:hemerythrin-like domain-containing protein